MNMTTALELNTLALHTHMIDELALLDKEAKLLEKRIKALKEQVANTYGEGNHQGDVYSVTVSLVNTSKTDWSAIATKYDIPATVIAEHTTRGVSIRVCPKA